jgi:Na+/H+ antiporter NhaD/arsenite permease-like protein
MNVSHGNASDFTPNVIFGGDPLIVATAILCFAYIFIITEKINRAIIALLGAGLMVLTGVLNQEAAIRGVDFNTLALLAGMMGIVAITKRSGIFQYVAVLSAKLVKGNPRALLVVLPLITAVFSALLDNVTTVMLIVPITLLLCEQLKLRAYPYLVAQIFASNIGGMATLIGDPPNILIGSAVNLSFMDFVYNIGPASVILFVLTTIFFDVVWGRKLETTDKARSHLQNYNEKEAIKDVPLLIKSLFTLGLVLFGFTVGHHYGVQPGTSALFGAAFLLLLDNIGYSAEDQAHRVQDALSEIEWETIFFFLGLFILVYGVEVAGLLDILATELLAFTEGDLQMTGMVIIWVSAVASAIVDNIPFVATMIPLIESMAPTFGGEAGLMPLWWCLSLGACLGGNGSLIGASANVMVASYAERAGQRISFIKFLKLGFPLMLATVAIASVYAWFMFLT